MKSITNMFVTVLVCFFFSCKKERDKPQGFDQTASGGSFARTFYYPGGGAMVSAKYSAATVTAAANILTDGSLSVVLKTTYPAGRDNITIVIPAAALKPGYTGVYPVVVSSSPAYQVSYQYRLASGSINDFLPGNAVGTIELRYKKESKMLAGTFSHTVVSKWDPDKEGPVQPRNTHINLDGSFFLPLTMLSMATSNIIGGLPTGVTFSDDVPC
jgi:hypothetical protein